MPREKGSHHLLIQVCETLQNPDTAQREVTALQEAMAELALKTALIVTRNEEKEITVSGGRVSVVPIWKFLLDFDDSPAPAP